jgi:hypothetical protein
MAISGDALATMSLQEMLDTYQPTKCAECGVTLHETTTGCRTVGPKCVCSDCYFRTMSDGLEQYPICIPRMHRGG